MNDVLLKYPIKVNGLETRTLTLKRPTAFDMSRSMAITGDEIKRSVFLVSILAGISIDDAWQLDFLDLKKCNEVVEDFFQEN